MANARYLGATILGILSVSVMARANGPTEPVEIPLDSVGGAFCMNCGQAELALPVDPGSINATVNSDGEAVVEAKFKRASVEFGEFLAECYVKPGIALSACTRIAELGDLRLVYPNDAQGQELMQSVLDLRASSKEVGKKITLKLEGENGIALGCEDNSDKKILLIRPNCGSQLLESASLELQ